MYKIVYEDNDIVVVNKAAGVLVHPDEHCLKGTLLQEIQKNYPNAELAHRLDKDTSGLLVVAKNNEAYEYVKSLFKNRDITKTYITLVVGEMTKEEDTIELPIGRSKKDFRKRIASPIGGDGFREAKTHWKIRKKFSDYTLLEVCPKTGRTHQIRSHLSSIGHPIACDKLYGGKRYMCPSGLNRQFLHATGLAFTAKNGKQIQLEAQLPSDLKKVLDTLKTV
jgi:23S rRNA pseudouridine1911/1915/1917 synthase